MPREPQTDFTSFVMVDIESINTDPHDPAIMQVGVCLFHENKFHTASIATTCDMKKANTNTLAFWARQPGFADLLDAVATTITSPRDSVRVCLNKIHEQMCGIQYGTHMTIGERTAFDDGNRALYKTVKRMPWIANPPIFDFAMLEGANVERMWQRRNIYCYRTMSALLGGDYRDDVLVDMSHWTGRGQAHDAGYDAEWQARALVKALADNMHIKLS